MNGEGAPWENAWSSPSGGNVLYNGTGSVPPRLTYSANAYSIAQTLQQTANRTGVVTLPWALSVDATYCGSGYYVEAIKNNVSLGTLYANSSFCSTNANGEATISVTAGDSYGIRVTVYNNTQYAYFTLDLTLDDQTRNSKFDVGKTRPSFGLVYVR
jgi:hypothetical protein